MKRNRNLKRFLAMFLALVMALSLMSVPAFAAELDDGDDPVSVSDSADLPDAGYEADDAADSDDSAVTDSGDTAEAPDGSGDAEEADAGSEDAAPEEAGGETEDADEAEEADGVSEDGSEDAAEAGADGADASASEDGAFDMSKTERPEGSETVTVDKGTADDKDDPYKDWTVFYDAESDTYKVTFNIGAEADGTQVVDLTQALEMLGQYVESGKEELAAAIEALAKPEKGDAGEEPAMGELPEAPAEPEKPEAFDQEEPVEPEAPVEPGVPENLEENVDKAYEDIIASVPRDDGGEPAESYDYAGAIAEATGLDKDDPYVKSMASYMYDQAMVDWCMSSWDKWEAEGHPYVNRFGDPDTFLFYGCGIEVKWPDGWNKGTPVLKQAEPVYEVDKTSDAYKAYELAKAEYDDALAQYQIDKAEYDAAFDLWMSEHADELAGYDAAVEAYEALKAEYEAKVAEIEAEYEAAMADYESKLAEIEAKYAGDKAAYDKAVAKLEAEFENRIGANVMQPGDAKKFELFITSDSKHTYKYQTGSFTLATPGWSVNENGEVVGFDGQILPDEYVDRNAYHVTLTAEPMQALFKAIGMDDPTHPNNKWNLNGKGEVALGRDGDGNITDYAGYWDYEIKKALAEYPGETLQEQLNAYILAYYGNEYETIDDLVAGNPDAMSALTKTATNGNKWFELDGQKFEVQAHTATVKYDQFYKNLFSFAFGDAEDIDAILGEATQMGDGRWEYENDSWTNNGAKMALAYYMAHAEIWQQTDAYFQALLDAGLTADQATWRSLVMALNIDGELTGNDWQNTRWPWYSSIQLDRNDYEFHLTKTDEDGNAITASPAEFQLWYVDADGNKIYLSQGFDADGEPIFVESTEPAYIRTENGSLEGLYSMMKDRVYYLKETEAPEGYTVDPTIYVIGGAGDDAYLEDLKAEAAEDIQKQIDELMNDEYAANKAALAEIQEKVDEMMAEDGMSALDIAAYMAELQSKLADLRADGMTIEELNGAIADAANGFRDAEAALRDAEAALKGRYDAAVSEIGRLDGELDSVKAEFDALKAAYEASEDINERNAMIDQMKVLQARAEDLTAAMAAVKASYEADGAHADYDAALAAAMAAQAGHNAYADKLNGLLDSSEYRSLQARIEALRDLKDAKDALDGSANAAELKALENRLKIESERLFKDIAKLQQDDSTDWTALLNLEVYLANRKAIEEGTYEIPALPTGSGTVDFETIVPDPVPAGGTFDFEVPPPEDPPEEPEDPPEEPPEEPEDPPEEPPEEPEIPDEPPPLDPGPPPEEPPEEPEIPDVPPPLDPGPPPEDPPVVPPEEPEVEIPDEEPPLSDVPEEEIPEEEEDIPDNDIPLADVPQTGDDTNMALYGVLAAVSLMGLCGLAVTGKKREEI